MQLPPIDHARHSPPEGYSHSPINGSFGNSSVSLPSANHGHYEQDNLTSPSPADSRRSSFDTRLNGLSITSPIGGTPSASQVSLRDTLVRENALSGQLARERGIQSNSPHPPPMSNDDHGLHSSGNPFAAGPGSNRNTVPSRTAPPIVGVPRSQYGQAPHPNDKHPTKGFPWAFPEPDLDIGEAGSRTSHHDPRASASSLQSSAAGSMYSANSNFPPPNGAPPMMPHMIPHMNQTHHHHGLQDRRTNSNTDATPYSRTPELRVSHKLAERKRRKEMKELFDELREVLPAERGGKSSKWEVLTKGLLHAGTLYTQTRAKSVAYTANAAIEHVKEQTKVVASLNERIGTQQEQISQQTLHLNQIRDQLREKDDEVQRLRDELHRRDGKLPTYEWPHGNNNNGIYTASPPHSNDGNYHNQAGSASKMQGIES